ncbi:hypothetical protein ACIP98_21080 [Streptomyces sp. NPDC088354]|uniref:hypothetical protein n=1 Tax=Streptomyces sp. NPDC088354 TaxID=3365856 RepID=UPI003811DF2F
MKISSAVAVIALSAGLVGVAAPAASAATCSVPTFCLYFNSNQQGAFREFDASVASFADGSTFNKIGTTNNGYGQGVWNNAASAKFASSTSGSVFGLFHARVYYNSNFMGAYDSFNYPGEGAYLSVGPLTNTYNNNASLKMW